MTSVGSAGYRVTLTAPGWLGKWLKLDGVIADLRPPVMLSEFVEMLGLYLLEKEEEEEAKGRAESGGT